MLLVLGMLSFNIMLILQLQEMKENYTCVSARLTTDVTKKQLSKALEEADSCKIESLTAFSQAKVLIEGKDIGRQMIIDAYCVYGNVEDVLPLSLIAGNLLIREDVSGCILTKDAAYELFGDIDAIGLEVRMDNRTYVVRGIISSNVKAIFYEARFDIDTFNCLEFKINDENGEFYARQFLNIYGLSEDYIIGENYLVQIAQNLCLFPFLIIMIYFLLFIEVKVKQNGVRKEFRIGFLALYIVLIIALGTQIGYFPERWIPSKWSNFDHFSNIVTDIKQQLKILLFAKPFAKEVEFRTDLVKTVVLFVASILGLTYILRNLNEWASVRIDNFIESRKIAHLNVVKEVIDDKEDEDKEEDFEEEKKEENEAEIEAAKEEKEEIKEIREEEKEEEEVIEVIKEEEKKKRKKLKK